MNKEKLEDIVQKMHQGINTVADQVNYLSDGYPILQSKNITKGFLDLEDVRFLSKHDYDFYVEKYKPKLNDILLTNIGTIGKSMQIKKEEDFLIAWNLFLIRVKPEIINPSFLKYFFDYYKNNNLFDLMCNGGTVNFINKKKMSELLIPVPSPDQQKHIVNVLDKLTDSIEDSKKQLQLLDELVEAKFDEMFGDETNFDTIENLTLKVGDGLHGTPKYDENGEFHFINGNNLMNTIVLNENNKKINFEEYKKIKKDLNANTLLISINGTLGNLAIYNNEKVALSKSVCYCCFKDEVDVLYMYYVFKSALFSDYIQGEKTGSTIKNISLKSMRGFTVPIPNIDNQQSFVNYAKEVELQKNLINEQINNQEELLNKKMQEYFD